MYLSTDRAVNYSVEKDISVSRRLLIGHISRGGVDHITDTIIAKEQMDEIFLYTGTICYSHSLNPIDATIDSF